MDALITEIRRWGGSFGRPIGTIYLGGGTPSLLGGRIEPLLDAVRESFEVLPQAEITAEMNPCAAPEQFLRAAHRAGVNRLSVGVQSGDDARLAALGRRHTAADARRTVELAREIGFRNLSVDLMLGLPGESLRELEQSADFALSLDPQHISSYLLKIEPRTRFAMEGICPADDEAAAEQYLWLCDRLRAAGYRHYEISNFARPGFEGRHNLKYWRGEEYLGIGPAAHSAVGGRRFYYPRDLHAFLKNPAAVPDGSAGSVEERIMLALRLDSGFDFAPYPALRPFLERLEAENLGRLSGSVFALSERGMLVSNSIISEILERIL